MTGGVRWGWRLRLSREVQVEQHRGHEARGAHGPRHPAGRKARGARESGGGDESSPQSSEASSGRRNGRRAVTQPLQKFPRSYLSAERGRERSAALEGWGQPRRGGASRRGAGRGRTRRGGARRTARPRGYGDPAGGGGGAPGCRDCWSPAAPRSGSSGAAREAGSERELAPGRPAPHPLRLLCTQGVLAQLLLRGCGLGRADWLPCSRPPSDWLWEKFPSLTPPSARSLAGLPPGELFSFGFLQYLHPSRFKRPSLLCHRSLSSLVQLVSGHQSHTKSTSSP